MALCFEDFDGAAAAANPVFGRLAASGWHTAAMTMRMTVERWARLGGASLGSPASTSGAS